MVGMNRACKHSPCLTRVEHGERPLGVVENKIPEEDPALRRAPGEQDREPELVLVSCSVPSV